MSGHALLVLGEASWDLWGSSGDDCAVAPSLSIPAEAEQTPDELAAALQQQMDAESAAVEAVVIALPSHRCLAAHFSTDGLPRRQRRQALAYRFEERLPLDLESLQCDFAIAGSEALGVAAERNWIASLVSAIERIGLRVVAALPLPLLVAQGVIAADSARDGAQLLLIQCDGGMDLVRLGSEGQPLDWKWHAGHLDELPLSARSMAMPSEQLPLVAIGLAPTQRDVMEPDVPGPIDVLDAAPMRCALSAAQAIAAGQAPPALDLHPHGQRWQAAYDRVRGPARLAAASLLLLLLCIAGGLLWRSASWSEMARRADQAQVDAYRSAFPDQTVPSAGLLSRLRSEARKLQGTAADAAGKPSLQDVMPPVSQSLGAIPEHMRVRLMEIRAEEGRLFLVGQSRSHGDAEAIAASIERRTGFEMTPPRTEKLPERGVGFTLSGQFSAKESP